MQPENIFENQQLILSRFTRNKLIKCFACFFIIYGIELFISKQLNIFGSSDFAFSTIGMALPVFLLCLQSDIKIENAAFFRRVSTIIYCGQANVLVINDILRNRGLSSGISFCAAVFALAAICTLILHVQKKKIFKWCDYFT